MKKFLLPFGFLIVSITINSCRQDDVILSDDDVTNLKKIQDARLDNSSNQLENTVKNTTVTFKQDEMVKPPR